MKNAKRLCWSEYFGDKVKVNYTQNEAPLYDNTSSNNYYVFDCEFEECTENGAIYIKRDNEIYTLIEDSAFRKCQSTSNGGSVYYYCSKGHFVQQRNSYLESIARYCMSFYQTVKSFSTNKNYAFDISVSKCGESESKGSQTFNIQYGDVQIKNINSTYNKCDLSCSIRSALSGKSGYCNFSTFRENNSTRTESLVFTSNSPSYIQTVSYCNVIGNKCRTDSEDYLFWCSYDTNVDHCVFLNNTAGCMFKIYYSDCTLTITDSYVQSKTTAGTGGIVKFERDKSNSDPINISHFSTENCFIEANVFAVKISYFSAFVPISPALFSSKK